MSITKRFIGIDLGAESGRCVAAFLSDGKLSLEEVHRFPTHNYQRDNEFHWDIQKIFNEIVDGLTKIVNQYGDDFESLSIDTWGVDYAIINEHGKLLNDPFHYRDDRTDNITDEVFKILSRELLYKKTGIQTMQFNTIFQLYSEYNSRDSKIGKADKFLLTPDYLGFLLTGEKYAEYTIASTTGLTDQSKRDWQWQIIDDLGYNKNIFPNILESGSIIGPLKNDICLKTGLKNDMPFIATAEHDTASAVVSAPARVDNWAFLSSGTWSIMGMELSSPVTDELAMEFNFTNEGGFNGTIRFCKNILGLWPIQECRRTWKEENEDLSYSELTEKADEIGYVNSWVNLNDQRFLKAGNMPSKVLSFLDETDQASQDEIGFIIRVLLESLAFSYKITLDEIEKVTGKKIKELNMFGGGIQNELLSQLTSDALNIPVIAGPIEGTIIGNIGVQAITNKVVNDLSEWRNVVDNSFELKVFMPKNPEYFEENKDRYSKIVERLNS